MNPHKLTTQQRRDMVLSALSGESRVEVSKRYNVARSWLYSLLDEAQNEPERKLKEAEAEVEFRRSVIELAVRKLAREEQ